MNNQFSENLKKIRKDNNLSQEQLADELGVSRQAISKWESAIAYPEMDKIIALCDKFHLNIDDLLHKDIKEVKGEEEIRKRFNSIFDDFLSFITDTINMFCNMSFKSKIKCLFEQFIIAFLLFLVSAIISGVLGNIFQHLFVFLPNNIFIFIMDLLGSVLAAALFIISIIVFVHIFKTRYLNYYEKRIHELKSSDLENEKDNSNDKTIKNDKKLENRIIIRDPKHSEYHFLNALFKIIIGIIKFFSLCFAMFIAFGLVFLFIVFVSSFLLYKTGIFFVGLLFSILSSSSIAVIILILLLNFVFNRKSDKKTMIWSFICSLILFGIGCGMIFVGSLSFDVAENNESLLKTVTKEYDMTDDLILYPHNNYEIEYISADNSNIKVEYSINKYCDIDDRYHENLQHTIMAWGYCKNPMKTAREFIKNLNDKKIVPIDDRIYKIKVYTNSENINILKNNWNHYLEDAEKKHDNMIEYENRIHELEEDNFALQQKINDLEEQLANQN